MRDLFKRAADWLTTERRQAIQGAVVSIASVLLFAGYGSGAQWEAVAVIVAAGLQVAGPLLNLANLRASELAAWWTFHARAAIYGAALALGPALTVLGVLHDADAFVAVMGLVLTAVSSVVAIWTAGKQASEGK